MVELVRVQYLLSRPKVGGSELGDNLEGGNGDNLLGGEGSTLKGGDQ